LTDRFGVKNRAITGPAVKKTEPSLARLGMLVRRSIASAIQPPQLCGGLPVRWLNIDRSIRRAKPSHHWPGSEMRKNSEQTFGGPSD
jgi:hypothetical protein